MCCGTRLVGWRGSNHETDETSTCSVQEWHWKPSSYLSHGRDLKILTCLANNSFNNIPSWCGLVLSIGLSLGVKSTWQKPYFSNVVLQDEV